MECINNIEYLNVDNKKYISISMNENIEIIDYQIEMVNNNQGNGIIYIDKQQLNEDVKFQYDITDYITFKEYILDPNIDGNNLFSIFNNLVNILISLPSFLLNINNIILDENYLMVDKFKKTIGIVYIPSKNKIQNTEEKFKQFIKEVIVECMNDKKNMQYFINEILPIVNSPTYSLKEISRSITSSKAKTVTSKIKTEENHETIDKVVSDKQEDNKHEGFLSSLFKHKGNKRDKTSNKTKNFYIIFNINDSFQEVKIDKDEFILGRLKGSVNYIVESNVVGKVHAKIIKSKNEIYISDLSSKNGTYVNGKKLSNDENCKLCNGDEIRLGNVVGKIKIDN